jgi:hypothetical protein
MNVVGGDTATYGINDGWNRLGNHLGTIDVGMEIDWKKAKLFLYRQSIYEDGSLYYGNNITDGLHGVAFTQKADQGIIKVVIEYLNTTSQGGSVFNGSSVFRGLDNYFNNAVYRDGWTYNGMGLGTPMLTLDSETDLTNTDGTFYDNNRVESFYMGVEAKLGENAFMLRGSMSNSIGWFGQENIPAKKQYSVGLQWQRPLQLMGYNTQLKATLGADRGSWKPDVIGGNVSLIVPLN